MFSFIMYSWVDKMPKLLRARTGSTGSITGSSGGMGIIADTRKFFKQNGNSHCVYILPVYRCMKNIFNDQYGITFISCGNFSS